MPIYTIGIIIFFLYTTMKVSSSNRYCSNIKYHPTYSKLKTTFTLLLAGKHNIGSIPIFIHPSLNLYYSKHHRRSCSRTRTRRRRKRKIRTRATTRSSTGTPTSTTRTTTTTTSSSTRHRPSGTISICQQFYSLNLNLTF